MYIVKQKVITFMKYIPYLIFVILISSCTNAQKKQVTNTPPEYKAFTKQKHRFELNGCTLTYNDKSFKLGATLQEFENVFGKDYEIKRKILLNFNKLNMIAWYEKGSITGIRFFLNKEVNTKIIVGNTLLNASDKMQDFIDKSAKFSFDDFLIKSDGYTVSFDSCGYEYVFDSPVSYQRKGSGHVYIKGDWKLNETNPIDAISIYKSN